MKALCICEKPSLMREVRDVYNKISFKDEVDFIALHGHIMGLKYPEEIDVKYKTWDSSYLPIVPASWEYHVNDEDTLKKITDALKENKYDYMINATDAEREGQNIFYSVYLHLGLTLPVKRLWLNDLNFGPIKEAWENLRDDLNEPFLKNLTSAALLRSQSDWLVGMNFSRAAHQRIGRVKTPTLQILYKREMEIKNFNADTCYKTKAYCDGFTMLNDELFPNIAECQNFFNKLSKVGTVKSIENTDKKIKPSLLYSLAELQADANGTYGYTLGDTLEIVQSLYEKKILTYPRTDCPYIPKGDAPKIEKSVPLMLKLVAPLTPTLETHKIPKRYVDDSKVQAHGAIIFTGESFDISELNTKQKNIAILVAKRILSTLMKDEIKTSEKMICDVDGYEFKANGISYKELGFYYLYNKGEDKSLPKFKKGDLVNIIKYEESNSTPKPPARYTDATLLKAMINIGNTLENEEKDILKGVGDQGGIGTPATRANIVESLLEPVKTQNGNAYLVERKGKSFVVTECGCEVSKTVENYSFASASLTAQWELKLNDVVNGKMTKEEFYHQILEYINNETNMLIEKNIQVYATTSSLGSCPVCGKTMIKGKTNFYCSGYRDKTCGFGMVDRICGAKITDKDVKDILSGKKTRKFKMTSPKTGKRFESRLVYDKEQQKVVFSFDSEEDNEIAKCSCGGTIVKHSGQYGDYYKCDNCAMTISKKYAGKNFSDKEITRLFNGEKVAGKFKSKTGKVFEAKVFFGDDKKMKMEFK